MTDLITDGVKVVTTNNSGLPPEYWAERLAQRIISIADDAQPAIRDQALAFQERIRALTLDILRQAQRSDRAHIIAALQRAGLHDYASHIREL